VIPNAPNQEERHETDQLHLVEPNGTERVNRISGYDTTRTDCLG